MLSHGPEDEDDYVPDDSFTDYTDDVFDRDDSRDNNDDGD